MLAEDLRAQVHAVLVEDFDADEIMTLHRYGADFVLDLSPRRLPPPYRADDGVPYSPAP